MSPILIIRSNPMASSHLHNRLVVGRNVGGAACCAIEWASYLCLSEDTTSQQDPSAITIVSPMPNRLVTLCNDEAVLQQALEKVIAIAKEAGSMIMQGLQSNTDASVHHKGTVDLVTDTDKKVEAFVISELTQAYPTSTFLAEESASNAYDLSDAPTWIIDPIDDELFTAVKGKGAFLNGKPIRVASAAKLQQAVISTNFGYDRSPANVEYTVSKIQALLLGEVQSLRSGGSAACEMTSVACGRLDAFYERGIHPWDIAAGTIIVEEAGGVVTDISGEPLDLLSRRVMCGNKQIVEIVSTLFKNIAK